MIWGKTREELKRLEEENFKQSLEGFWTFAWRSVRLKDGRRAWLQRVFARLEIPDYVKKMYDDDCINHKYYGIWYYYDKAV